MSAAYCCYCKYATDSAAAATPQSPPQPQPPTPIATTSANYLTATCHYTVKTCEFKMSEVPVAQTLTPKPQTLNRCARDFRFLLWQPLQSLQRRRVPAQEALLCYLRFVQGFWVQGLRLKSIVVCASSSIAPRHFRLPRSSWLESSRACCS